MTFPSPVQGPVNSRVTSIWIEFCAATKTKDGVTPPPGCAVKQVVAQQVAGVVCKETKQKSISYISSITTTTPPLPKTRKSPPTSADSSSSPADHRLQGISLPTSNLGSTFRAGVEEEETEGQ